MHRYLPKPSTVLALLAILSVPTTNEGATTKYIVSIGSSVDITCPQKGVIATLRLGQAAKRSGPYRTVNVDGVKVQRHGWTFTINNLTSSTDKGFYQCRTVYRDGRRVLNNVGEISKPILNTHGKPSIFLQPQKQSVLEGGIVFFTCTVVSKSRILAVGWYKDAQRLPQALQTYSSVNNLHTNVLRLRNVKLGDRGVYECRAKTLSVAFQSYYPARAQLKVKKFAFLSKSQEYLMAVVGSSLKINCRTSDHNASVSLWVTKRSGIRTKLVPDQVKVIQKRTRFIIHKVALADEGLYTCEATNKQGKVITKDMGQFIPSQGGYRDPKAHVYPHAKTLGVGDNFNFSCLALGDMISFTWLKHGTAVPSNQVKVLPARDYQGFKLNEAFLLIKGASRSDVATYTCRITSGVQPGYIQTATASLKLRECPKPNGKFADPDNRNGYIICRNWTARKRNCQNRKHHWSSKLRRCRGSPVIPTTPFLRWNGKQDKTSVAVPIGGSYTFDCSTTDPSLTVTLLLSRHGKPKRPVTQKVKRQGQVFTLRRLELGRDGGKYYCRTADLEDHFLLQLYFDMHLSFQVNVSIRPSSISAMHYGDSARISCVTYNRGDVAWYRVDGKDPGAYHRITKERKGSVVNGHLRIASTLDLTSVSKKDAGRYMCRKNNSIGAVANATIDVVVREPTTPYAGIRQTRFSKTENEPVQIRCTVSGSPWPQITWYRGDTAVATCSGGQTPSCEKTRGINRSNYRVQVVKFSYSELKIRKAKYPVDNRMYRCTATNLKGVAEDKTNLRVYVAPKIKKNNGLDTESISVLKSSSYKLRCQIRRSHPAPKITWQFQTWPCSSKDHTCKADAANWRRVRVQHGRVTESGPYNSTLLIPPSNNFAFYRCIAINHVAQDILVYEVRRTITQTNKLLQIKGPDKKQFDEHDNITLTCTGHSAFDAPPYWLDKNNRIIVASNRVKISVQSRPLINTTRLHIFGASANDTGVYKCEAKRRESDDIQSTAIHLRILSVSAPTVILDDQTVNETNTVTLQCHVTGHPNPEVLWYKDGRELPIKLSIPSASSCEKRLNGLYHLDKQDSKEEKTYTLVLCKAIYNDTGRYECRAENTQGDDKDDAYLDVLARPVIYITDNGFVTVPWKTGDELIAECYATGNPTPKVRWMKESDVGYVPVDDNSTWVSDRQKLHIQSLAEDDFMTYMCVAVNSVQRTEKEYYLQAPPKAGRSYAKDKGEISKPTLIGLAVTAGIVIVLLLVIIVVLYRRKQLYGGFYIFTLPPMEDYFKKLDPAKPLLEQTHKLPWNAEWEFSRDRIKLQKIIGSGAFGQVYLAEAVGITAFDPRGSLKGKGRRRSRFGSTRSQYMNNKQVTMVACKGLKESATDTEYRDLLSELKILMHIGEHKNIVNLLGACTKGRECELLVIIEYCPYGNLLEFLRKRRDVFEAKWAPATEKPDEIFTLSDLVITSYQVVRAMQFLASRKCVHRDLAARNVLVGENYVIKIADFGLARDIYKNEHYVKTTAGLLPVKWMAIEALVDQVYTHNSDVWSFGVLLWEIFTLGGSPYPGLPANEVYQYLMEGQRMEQPQDCPDEIYELMLGCWQHDPNQRPTFTNLLESIDKILEEKTTETGECYLDLEHDGTADENQPEYLEPEEITSPPPPETPLEDKNFPLPPVPYEEIELKDIPHMQFPDLNDNKKRAFVLDDAPKGKSPQRLDSETEKVQKDSMEREKSNKSDSSASSQSMDGEFISEKEQWDNEEEKDVCERNSGVFNDSPPPYINSRPFTDNMNSRNYDNDVGYRKDRGFRPREQSARYVDA